MRMSPTAMGMLVVPTLDACGWVLVFGKRPCTSSSSTKPPTVVVLKKPQSTHPHTHTPQSPYLDRLDHRGGLAQPKPDAGRHEDPEGEVLVQEGQLRLCVCACQVGGRGGEGESMAGVARGGGVHRSGVSIEWDHTQGSCRTRAPDPSLRPSAPHQGTPFPCLAFSILPSINRPPCTHAPSSSGLLLAPPATAAPSASLASFRPIGRSVVAGAAILVCCLLGGRICGGVGWGGGATSGLSLGTGPACSPRVTAAGRPTSCAHPSDRSIDRN